MVPALYKVSKFKWGEKRWISDLGDGIPGEQQITEAGPLELSGGVEGMEAGHEGFVALIQHHHNHFA